MVSVPTFLISHATTWPSFGIVYDVAYVSATPWTQLLTYVAEFAPTKTVSSASMGLTFAANASVSIRVILAS